MPGILDLDPQTQGLLQAAFAGLQASGPSRMPTSFGQVLGTAGSAGLSTYDQAARLQSTLAMQKLQQQKLQDELDIQKQIFSMTGGDPSKLATDPDLMEKIGILGAARGHAGYSGFIGQAEKIRKKRADEAQFQTMQSTGAVAPDVQETQQAADQGLPAPTASPQGGLFSSLYSSPYVGQEAKLLQTQMNAARTADPEAWLKHYERLRGSHTAQATAEESRAQRLEMPGIIAGLRNPQILQSDQGIFAYKDGKAEPVLGPNGQPLRPTATARIDMSTANQLQRQFNAATKPSMDALGSTGIYRNARETGDTAQAAMIAAEALRRSARGGNQRFSADLGRILGSGYGSGSIVDRMENFISNELKGAPSNATLAKLDALVGATEQSNLEQIGRFNKHYAGQAKAHGIPVKSVIGAPTVEGRTVVFPEGEVVRFKTPAEAAAKAEQWTEAN
jgi:hypothetical protein